MQMWWHGLRCVAIKMGTRGERVMWKRRSCHDWWSETGWGASFSFFPPPDSHSTPIWGGEGRRGSEALPRSHKLQKRMSGQTKWTWKVVLNKGKLVQKCMKSQTAANGFKLNHSTFCTPLWMCIWNTLPQRLPQVHRDGADRVVWELPTQVQATFPTEVFAKGSITSHC